MKPSRQVRRAAERQALKGKPPIKDQSYKGRIGRNRKKRGDSKDHF